MWNQNLFLYGFDCAFSLVLNICWFNTFYTNLCSQEVYSFDAKIIRFGEMYTFFMIFVILKLVRACLIFNIPVKTTVMVPIFRGTNYQHVWIVLRHLMSLIDIISIFCSVFEERSLQNH